MHTQEIILLLSLRNKTHLNLESRGPRWQRCLIFVQTFTRQCLKSKKRLWPFPPDSSHKWTSPWTPRVPGTAGLAQHRKSVYLESCCRLRIGKNQRRNEDHAGEVAWPLRGREDGDGTSLQSRTGQGCRVPASASAHISNKHHHRAPPKLQAWPGALGRSTLE